MKEAERHKRAPAVTRAQTFLRSLASVPLRCVIPPDLAPRAAQHVTSEIVGHLPGRSLF